MPKTIHPLAADLTADQHQCLYDFFITQDDIDYWPKNTPVGEYILACDVIKRFRVKKGQVRLDQTRYECFEENKPLNQGKSCDDEKSCFVGSQGTFHLDEKNRITQGNPNKSRGIKIVSSIYTDAKEFAANEYQMSPPHIHAKPPVVALKQHSIFRDPMTKIFLVEKKFTKENLLSFLQQHSASFKERIEIMKAILLAYEKQVSGEGLIHWDIKPENIMIDKEGSGYLIQFIDYEYATKITDKSRSYPCGTVLYSAPEINKDVIDSKTHHVALDIYSLGQTFKDLFSISVSFKTNGNLFACFKPSDAFFTKEKQEKIRCIIKSMCDKEPANRPSIEAIIQEMDKIKLKTDLAYAPEKNWTALV